MNLTPMPLFRGLVIAAGIFVAAPVFSASPCFAKTQNSAKIDRINQAILSKKEKIESAERQKISIYKELQRMDAELKIGQQKLLFLQDRLLRQEEHIKQKEDEIIRIQAEKDAVGEHVQNRLRSFYQMDDISIINTLFSASSLPELLNLKQYFQAMFQYDQQILQNYSTKINLLDGAKVEIIKEKEKLLDVILEAQKQEEMLIAARQARTDLLKRIQTEEKLYRHALAEIKEAAQKLTKKLASLRVKVIRSKKRKIATFKSNKKRVPPPTVGFATLQGKLRPPVPGKVVTYFGNYTDKFNNQLTSSGINIKASETAKITSISSGTVIFSGTMDSYGKMVIIDHGEQYHSLVSGLDSIIVKTNDHVETGQQLGTMGNNTTLLSQGLHFEIRENSHPVDPLLWLDGSKLTSVRP